MPSFVVNVKIGATATNATSEVLHIGEYANAAGTKPSILKCEFSNLYENGAWTSVILQDSADNSSYSTLWDCGTLDGDQYIFLYTWDQYIRAYYSYTAGTTTADPGGRIRFTVTPFGLPDWDRSHVCRWEHCRAIMPQLFDTSAGYQATYGEQRTAAKREIEMRLRSRGVDHHSLFNDAHNDEPVLCGLEQAGALLTLRYILVDANIVKSESWKMDIDRLDADFLRAFDDALNGGIVRDLVPDGVIDSAGAGEPVRLRLSR